MRKIDAHIQSMIGRRNSKFSLEGIQIFLVKSIQKIITRALEDRVPHNRLDLFKNAIAYSSIQFLNLIFLLGT